MILWLLLVLGIAPCLIGSFVISITDKTDRRKIGMDYVTGMLVMLAVFQLLAIPFTILKRSLTELAVVYSVVLVAIAFFSIWNLRNVYKTEKFKVEKEIDFSLEEKNMIEELIKKVRFTATMENELKNLLLYYNCKERI